MTTRCDHPEKTLHGQCVTCGVFLTQKPDAVNHPSHYGGKDNPYEAIKVIRAWNLGFSLGNAVKYIARHEHKGANLEDLRKARWYLDEEIAYRESHNEA